MRTVRPPVLNEANLGQVAYRRLHVLRRQRRRSPGDQALQLILYALHCSLAGQDVELSQTQLEELLEARLQEAASMT